MNRRRSFIVHELGYVRATPETAEDLTQSISAGGKSKDILRTAYKDRKVYYSPAGGKSKEKKLKGKPPAGALFWYLSVGKSM